VGGSGPKGDSPGSHSVSTSYNQSDMARRVLRTEEILTADRSTGILLHGNLPVIPVRLIKYYKDKEFKKGWFGYGTGRPQGLGLAGGIAACLVLAASIGLATLATYLPEREVVRRAILSSAGGMANPRPQSESDNWAFPDDGSVGDPASLWEMPVRPLPSGRRSGRSTKLPTGTGYLIPTR
jgi:hypothetical protein